MTAREAILDAIADIQRRTGRAEFTVVEVVRHLKRSGSPYKESTIRTHVVSHMCINSPRHGANYNDLVRIDRGLYKLATPTDIAAATTDDGPSARTRPRRAGSRRDERIEQQASILISEFELCLEAFNGARLFTGPSMYFHEATIRAVREHHSPSQAIEDPRVCELIYATLASWGMHRMGRRGSKLTEYPTFRKSLQDHTKSLDQLASRRLSELAETEAGDVADTLWKVIAKLDVSATASRLVAGAKTIHHLLPDLVPPIDRQYTAQFFYGPSGKTLHMGEERAFIEMFPQLARIARERAESIRVELSRPEAYMATSQSKIVDNGIVGFVLRQTE